MRPSRKKINKNKEKIQNIVVLVVEGETESNYIGYLNLIYNKKLKLKIERRPTLPENFENYLSKISRKHDIEESEIVLIYDLEQSEIEYHKFINNDKLKHKNTYLTQPTIELHFLLHKLPSSVHSNTHLTSKEALKKMELMHPNYKKGNSFNWDKNDIKKFEIENARIEAKRLFKSYNDKSFSMIGKLIDDYFDAE